MAKEIDPIEEGKRLQAEAVAAQEEADKIAPYPSQEQNDRAKLGDDLDHDAPAKKAKDVQADKPAGYQTRVAKAD